MAKRIHPDFYKYAVGILRHGYINSETGKRMGKFADGFDAKDGYDLRRVDEWTPAQKAAVTRLYRHVNHLAARPFKIYKTKNKKRLRSVQEFSQHEYYPKKLKVAFVPVGDPSDKIKIKVRGDVVSMKEKNVLISKIPLDSKELLRDPKATIEMAIANRPEKSFAIQAGKYEIQGTHSRSQIADEVLKLMNKYSADRFDKNNSSSHYFGNWMGGLVAYKFDKLRDKEELDRAKSAFREGMRLPRRRHRTKAKKVWGYTYDGK
jgi:hypothetical protein